MHILTLDKDGATLPAGRYICEDLNAAQYLLLNQAVRPRIEPYKWERTRADGRILVVGHMGFGDALMLTPALRELKCHNPERPIEICCMAAQRQVFAGLPYVDSFVDDPVSEAKIREYGTVLFLEGVIELNDRAREMHMTDCFMEHFGLGSCVANKKADLILSTDELEWAKKTFPRNKGKRRLGIQVQAGARCRTYPMSQFVSEMDKMVKADWEVALLGSPGEFSAERLNKGIVDMTRFGLTWRQSAAFLTTCDAFLGPDSSLLHAAGALDVPGVGLFGPYPWEIRTKYYPSIFALHGNGACPMAPCHHSHHSGLPIFPAGGPCNQSGLCDELASITPERIRGKIEAMARRPIEAPPPALPAG